jgi:hypothetical protein
MNAMRVPFRVQPSAEAVAGGLPAAEEARVRDILAVAGGDFALAAAALIGALGELVARRVDQRLQTLILSGFAIALVRAVRLRSDGPAGRC